MLGRLAAAVAAFFGAVVVAAAAALESSAAGGRESQTLEQGSHRAARGSPFLRERMWRSQGAEGEVPPSFVVQPLDRSGSSGCETKSSLAHPQNPSGARVACFAAAVVVVAAAAGRYCWWWG